MKLKAKIFAAAVCAVALCVALAGCAGGGTAGSADNSANFQGTWVLSGGNADGQELTAESIEAMEQMGLHVYIQMNEGGSAVVSLFGSDYDGTWEAKDAPWRSPSRATPPTRCWKAMSWCCRWRATP